jgi:hypothetical protein
VSGSFVILIVVVVVIVAAIAVFAIALARRSKAQLSAGTEVIPGMPPGAPPEWAGAHSPEAKMHRRLVAMAKTMAALPLGDAMSIERGVAVHQEIQSLDGRLIALAPAPESARREAVAAMEPQVDAAEAEVGALVTQAPHP